MQRDLYAEPLQLTPAPGRTEPRLWVRRIVIWKEPGQELRNIPLNPGLNIVWSPDDGSQRGQIGHGGGKTTFCRLLRYCLGEPSLGSLEQRKAISDKMPMASVGAEVRLDGETWLIQRALDNATNDFAFRGPSFGEVSEFPSERTGMKPFRDAVTCAFLDDALPLLPAEIGEDSAWQAMLAWLSRDQECRFAHLLDWRSADSGSGSPVSGRGRSQDDREAIVRIVLNALGAEEIETKRQQEAAKDELRTLSSQLQRLQWRRDGSRDRFAAAFGLNRDIGADLGVAALKSAASEQLAKASGGAEIASAETLRSVRTEAGEASARLSKLQTALEVAEAKKAAEERLAAVIASELPELSAKNQRLEHPICEVCGVLIDKARAEGCGLAVNPCDLEVLRQRVEQRKTDHRKALEDAKQFRREVESLKPQIALAEQQRKQKRDRLDSLETTAFARSEAIRRAERLQDDVLEFEQVEGGIAEVEAAIATAQDRVDGLSAKLGDHRSKVAGAISDFSDRFDAVFRELVPNNARCVVKLDGNGFGIRVPVSGTAIDSLKVVVFDLAALTFAIEGKLRHPGFLIHDSPREADLGRQIYNNFFDVAAKLESDASPVLFQYIVTTTTEPPSQHQSFPRLCLKLRGSPAEERLLTVDF